VILVVLLVGLLLYGGWMMRRAAQARQVEVVTICGTDRHIFSGEVPGVGRRIA
jgi:hypothetical protein